VDDVLATAAPPRRPPASSSAWGAGSPASACLIELEFLGGRSRLEGYDLVSLIQYA